MKLFKQVEVFSPQSIGIKDVLVAGDKIIAVEDTITNMDAPFIEVVECEDQILVPGFVDSLVHISGGGGEGGYATRTPEMDIKEAFIGGVTTVIGALGTDAESRSLENLLAKAHGLDEQGLSVYCHTGSYHFPMVSILSSVKRDIMFIDKFIGVGEVAIADHRSSQMTAEEMARVASKARIGGMLSGKAGVVSIHVGDETDQLSLLHKVIEGFDIPITQFYPTHINRTELTLQAGFEFAKQGGQIDFTTSTTPQIIEQGEIPAAEALARAIKEGIGIDHLTMSSDGNASLPIFDDKGQLINLQVGRVKSLHQSMVDAVQLYGVDFQLALSAITSSPSDILKLKHKGRVAIGHDADINLLDKNTLAIRNVFAKGIHVFKEGEIINITSF